MFALPPKADIERRHGHLCFVPLADITKHARIDVPQAGSWSFIFEFLLYKFIFELLLYKLVGFDEPVGKAG